MLHQHLFGCISHTGLAFPSFFPKCELLCSRSTQLPLESLTSSCLSRLHIYSLLPFPSRTCLPPVFPSPELSISFLPPTNKHTTVYFGAGVYFRERGLKAWVCPVGSLGLQLSLGLWVTELSSSKDSFVPKSLLNPRTQKSELPPSNLVALSSPTSRSLSQLYLMSWLYLARRSERQGAPVLI